MMQRPDGVSAPAATRRALHRRHRTLVLLLGTVLATAGCGLLGGEDPEDAASLAVPTEMAESPTTTTATPSTTSTTATPRGPASWRRSFRRVARITGDISPKSVVASPDGYVTAQNMMYRHTVTVYDGDHELVRTIPDRVVPSRFGYSTWRTVVRGAPVEASFSPDGESLWVSNYSMYGKGFGPEGSDSCTPQSGYDRSFVYRISTSTWRIEDIVLVGSVPKYVQTSPDGRYVLVTNWCTWDLSIVDAERSRLVAKVQLGRYPRGIAISPDSSRAYVAVMGSSDVAVVDIPGAVARKGRSQVLSWFRGVGAGPRHLNLSPNGRYLYATLNAAGQVAKIDARTGRVLARVSTGRQPRSSVLSPDGTALFVVNYESDTVTRLRTKDMARMGTVKTDHHPIGITYSPANEEIWVAAYVGSITVFKDQAA
ncbi:MAG: YncE family protein [Actinomycetales bacterium]|nr:YncE family protein [Actinomycetales bacterium]